MLCPRCGNQINESDKFCKYCGTEIANYKNGFSDNSENEFKIVIPTNADINANSGYEKDYETFNENQNSQFKYSLPFNEADKEFLECKTDSSDFNEEFNNKQLSKNAERNTNYQAISFCFWLGITALGGITCLVLWILGLFD